MYCLYVCVVCVCGVCMCGVCSVCVWYVYSYMCAHVCFMSTTTYTTTTAVHLSPFIPPNNNRLLHVITWKRHWLLYLVLDLM